MIAKTALYCDRHCARFHINQFVGRGLSLLVEAVTVDGGKMSADDFRVLVEPNVFDIRFINSSCKGIQELLPFCIVGTFPLGRGSCYESLFRFKKIFSFYPFFIYVFFILRFRQFEIQVILAVFMIFQGMIPYAE